MKECKRCGVIYEDSTRTICSNCRSIQEQQLEKPPLGLIPRYIEDAFRIEKIHAAIVRFVEAKHIIPIEWIEEYNELVGRLGTK